MKDRLSRIMKPVKRFVLRFITALRERIRRFIVTLKRRPHFIPLVFLAVCCVIYTFRLTVHSNASMYVGSQTIALYVFIITLAAFLVIFSYMNAYAKRAKHKAVMRCIALALTAGQIVLDIVYLNIMHYETMIRDNPVPVTPDISSSQFWTVVHLVALGITLLAMLSLPLYHKLILKINTTISDDEGEAFAGVGSNDEKLTWDEDQWA